MRGKKRTLLGTTPFEYQARFHSEISVLRIEVMKEGYKTLPTKLSAKQDEFTFRLLTRSSGLAAETVKDVRLRNIQKRINPVIDSMIPLLIKEAGLGNDDVGLLRIAGMGTQAYLVVPLKLGKDKISAKVRRETGIFVNEIWEKAGSVLLGPLAAEIQKEGGLDGIVLNVDYSELKSTFQVNSRVETRVEMECQGGYVQKQVWDYCARRVQEVEYYYDSSGHMQTRNAGTKCEGGMISKSVFDQCAFKAPITKSTVKSDPRTTISKDQYSVRYIHSFSSDDPGKLGDIEFQDLDILCKDSTGKVIFKQGEGF